MDDLPESHGNHRSAVAEGDALNAADVPGGLKMAFSDYEQKDESACRA